jgi:hypothetical protein
MSVEKPRKRNVKKDAIDQKAEVTSPAREKNATLREDQSATDPLIQMFQFYDAFSKTWSDAMSKAVSSKSFAESMGRQIETGLDTMMLMRRQMGDLTEQYLQQLSLPTRNDFINLSGRLTNLEMAIDDINAKLDELLQRLDVNK